MAQVVTPLSAAASADPTNSAHPAGRILVVEDDPAVQKALKRLFETEGYRVEVQADGKSALLRPSSFSICACPSFQAGIFAKK